MKKYNGYHFVNETLRDGTPIPKDGVILEHKGPLRLCSSGLHASKTVWQALPYAPGNICCRVNSIGRVVHGEDKLVSSKRVIVCRINAGQILRKFARLCALDVIDAWDAPEIVREYLETGDEDIKQAAESAAGYAESAARYAARSAAESAAGYAESAARYAARSAAESAAGYAESAARYAESAARYAARSAAESAAGYAALKEQNTRLTKMIDGEFNRIHGG